MFLKNRFGENYNLVIVKKTQSKVAEIESFIK